MLKIVLLFAFLAGIPAMPSQAVVFYSTGDPAFHTTAPTNELEGSGWQFQGRFNSYLGTPVSPHHFITAKHIGGAVGNTFYYDGQTYTVTNSIADAGSDLRLWQVDGRFDRYAPVYAGNGEFDKLLVVFGRGYERGAAVTSSVLVASSGVTETG